MFPVARATVGLTSTESLQQPTRVSPPSINFVSSSRVIIAHNYHYHKNHEPKSEAYDFISIIDSKLSDIQLENFGREWFYDRVDNWLTTSAKRDSKSKILLCAGDPVR